MSTVWLQIGQCGNQVGQQWWEHVTRDKARHVFQAPDGKLSALCVDSELKVIRRLRREIKHGIFRDSNIILGHGGRGGNWALGYHGPSDSSQTDLVIGTMESFRKEVERLDSFCGVIILHSLSGGTGSGLGSRLCEMIREEFPLGQLLAVTVCPHRAGESPVQNYNALLCLSHLHRFADGVLLFHNDEDLGQGRLAGAGSRSLTAMNSHIAHCLAGLLTPVSNLHTHSGVSIGLEPWQLLRSVCPVPAIKFLHSSQANTRTKCWDGLVSSLLPSVRTRSPSGQTYWSTAILAVTRGPPLTPGPGSGFASLYSLRKRLSLAYNCVTWNPHPVAFWSDPRNIIDVAFPSRSLTVCANHGSVAEYMGHVVGRARDMYQAGAYLHWYWRHGCEQSDFLLAFQQLSCVQQEYSTGMGSV